MSFVVDADPIHAVSLGIAGGAAGLLMSLWLASKVCQIMIEDSI
jgi:hypothetical protein